MFKWYKAREEKETGKKLKYLISDRGGEFMSNEFTNFCIENRIRRQVSTSRTPKQNAISERRNMSIVDCTWTQLIEKGVSQIFREKP